MRGTSRPAQGGGGAVSRSSIRPSSILTSSQITSRDGDVYDGVSKRILHQRRGLALSTPEPRLWCAYFTPITFAYVRQLRLYGAGQWVRRGFVPVLTFADPVGLAYLTAALRVPLPAGWGEHSRWRFISHNLVQYFNDEIKMPVLPPEA